jgi:hypothetical protein
VAEAFLGKLDVPCQEGGIADSLPLVVHVGFASEIEGDAELVEAERKFESVLAVGRDFESLLLVTLTLEESSDLVLLLFGNITLVEHLGRRFEISTQDERLIFDNANREGKRRDTDILVANIYAAVSWEVAEHVVRLVKV